MAVQVNGDYRPCPVSDRAFQESKIDRVRLGIHIYEDGGGSDVRNGEGCGDEGVGSSDDFITRADVEGSQC